MVAYFLNGGIDVDFGASGVKRDSNLIGDFEVGETLMGRFRGAFKAVLSVKAAESNLHFS